ncbi:MAG: GGDEF domain-containing protein [Candidatus Eisenbacteria bacterium]|nr:GGDEF domain-containing protein [Candidatus Eisenbacteria bacterium]
MKRKPIPFDQLLSTVLPVDRLPLVDQADIRAALGEGEPARIEKVALDVIQKLTRLGHLRALDETTEGDERVLRYRDLHSANTISLRLPVAPTSDGVFRLPLPLRDWKGATSLDEIRSILTLYNRILARDSSLLAGVPDILRQIVQASRSVLGCDQAHFVSVREAPGVEGTLDPDCLSEPYDPYLIREWVVGRNHLVHVPEISPAARASGRIPPGMSSLALVPLGDKQSPVQGVLQAWSARPRFFTEDRLGLLALLSESGTDILSRAAILADLVFVDAATKVYNRSYFNLQLENEIARARRESKGLALIIVDIDDFKRFNSQYGYEGGNDVLTRVARHLKSGLRPFDSVARWGGEEFAMILTAPIGMEHARTVCGRLRRGIERQAFNITGLEGTAHAVNITVSGGGALYPDDAVNGADLWRAANAALVWSKDHGKNRVTFFGDLGGGSSTPLPPNDPSPDQTSTDGGNATDHDRGP